MRKPPFPMAAACGLLTLVGSLAVAPPALAAGPTELSIADEAPPPTELSDAIRAELPDRVIRLADEDGVFFEFWFRKAIPVTGEPEGGTHPASAVPQGALLGAVKVHRERYDFRDEEIPPGVYTLRMGVQPIDGDHLGTSPTRTFALLLPAKEDPKPDRIEDETWLFDTASMVNAAFHPSNLNIQPPQQEAERFPMLAAHNDDEHKVIYLRLPAAAGGSDASATVTFALVYEGMGVL